MRLLQWRLRNCLLLLVLLVERGLARADSELESSGGVDGDSEVPPGQHQLPAEESAGDHGSHASHGRPQNQRHDHQPQARRDHAHRHDRQHKHRRAHLGANTHHRQHDKHQLDHAHDQESLPLPLNQPRALSRSDDGDAHDLVDCQPQQGDRLLARSVVTADFRPLGFAEASWFYPQNGRDQRTINCVRVLDQRRDGNGGYPRVVRGGVGHHYVELSFKSDFSRGFHFVVEVYGQ